MQTQLLNLFNQQYSFDNYITVINQQTVDILKSQQPQFINLYGNYNLGKTHLLMSWVNLAHNQHKSAIYLNLINDEIIDNLEQKFSYIALDNIDQASEKIQEKVFNLFNQIKLNNLHNKLLTSSSKPLEKCESLRNDLKTRLLSGINLILIAPNDEELTQIIDQYIQSEGITLDTATRKYIITHYSRNVGAIIELINQASKQALIHNKSITIQLIKDTIQAIK